jgi:hypothetical protein
VFLMDSLIESSSLCLQGISSEKDFRSNLLFQRVIAFLFIFIAYSFNLFGAIVLMYDRQQLYCCLYVSEISI